MIEFKLPRLRGVNCNICHKSNDVVEITFRSDLSNSGHTVAICHDCRKTLAQLLKGCGGVDGGETVCDSTEPVVHCCECEHWNLETEQPNSSPRQCECEEFSNSSVSHYTNENGYCYRGRKRQSMTTRDWLRTLTDEELVHYLNWTYLCPKPYEKCGSTIPCAKCIEQELKKERVSRAQLRGKPLDPLCKMAHTTTGEYGVDDKRVFCYGICDLENDEPLEMCASCKAFVRNEEPPAGGGTKC